MRTRTKWMAVALLLALLACREHPFSKERFLKECDIDPERMLLSPEQVREEISAGHFSHFYQKESLLRAFEEEPKLPLCEAILQDYDDGFFMWWLGRGADSLLADHLIAWALLQVSEPEDVIRHTMKYAFAQPTERNITITRVCSKHLDEVNDSLACLILRRLHDGLQRPEEKDWQEIYYTSRKGLEYTARCYGTESGNFQDNLTACADDAMRAGSTDWPMWADSLYRYGKERHVKYRDGRIYSLRQDPLFARFRQVTIERKYAYAKELLDYLTASVYPLDWSRHYEAECISSALSLLNLQYWVNENDKDRQSFWLSEIKQTIEQYIGPPGFSKSLLGCLSPYYEFHPGIASLLSTWYRNEDFEAVYSCALKVKNFTDDFSALLLREVAGKGTTALRHYVDSVRFFEGKVSQDNPFLNFMNGEYEKSLRFGEELKALHTDRRACETEEVRRVLGADEVAIEVVGINSEPLGWPRMAALVLTPDKTKPEKCWLTDEPIKTVSSILAGEIYGPDSDLSLLAERLLPYVQGKTVFFASTDTLDLVNISALCTREGRRLRDECHFVNVFSTRSLCEKKHPALPSSIALLNGSSDLKGANDEIGQIRRLARSAGVKVTDCRTENASRESVLSLSGHSPAVLHISAHGIYNGPGEGGRNHLADVWEHCGLQMADGMLSAMDIARMNLTGTDLVVLSACNSGLGEPSNEGLIGLRRAFRRSGVKSLLITLSRVDDDATRCFMERFYRHLFAGTTQREAYDRAVEWMRNDERYADARYWAPFILIE